MKRSLFLCVSLLLLCCQVILAQEKKAITGKIQDAKGNPIIGASIQEKGTTNGTTSDADGNYKLNVSSNATVIISSVGYLKQELPAGSHTVLNARLDDDTKGLSEVVVTAMGIKKDRRKVGYAISTVSGEDIVKSSPTNFASALYGRAAGVKIQSAPGGGTSAVNIKIRGLNSINGDNQPLIVVDGVPIRNDIVNNGGYWSDTRIRGNSLLDINPDNIADINILKGAAATALYGSSGSNGVVMITTKSGTKGRGLGVDVNYSYGVEQVGVTPDLQTTYGPGYDRATNKSSFGADDDGWIHMGTINGKDAIRPIFRAYAQFGPKMEGQDVYWWDGQFRKYVSHKNNWKQFYRDGYSSIANVAISNASDKLTYRFSYTRNDYQGVQIGGKQQKNTFNFNTTYKITPKLTTDIVLTYVNEKVHNRPEQINRVTSNYGGFFSSADYMDVYMNKYKTSKGYKWVKFDDTSKDPAEAIKYSIRAYDYMDFLWKQLENSYDERSNRLLSSLTLSYEIAKDLKLRGRIGNDFTGYSAETMNRAEFPLSFGESGAYATNNNVYNIVYGDVLLSYNKQLSKNIGFSASAGYQARREENRFVGIGTNGGLTQENWFSLNASKNPISASSTYRQYYQQDGLFGTVSFDYKNFLFLEGTGRYERASTLAPGNNAYFYPSVSASLELTKALKLPSFVDYSKLRLSYGEVATAAGIYSSNVVYSGYTMNGVPALLPQSAYGNNNLKPERKHEVEVGWETKLLNNRLGFDVSYYNGTIKGQIINLTIPSSTGANSIWKNVGDLNNYGLEVALNGTPVTTRNFDWNMRATLGYNRNKLKSLMPGMDKLVLSNVDNGSLLVTARVGEAAGDIMGYKRKQDAQGNYMIDANGYYIIDFDHQVKLGNIQADLTGGLANTLRYKNWTLDFLVDFRWGGQMISTSNYYGTGAGMYKSTLAGRDAEHGGVAYYVDGSGKNVAAGSGAPAGAKVYHDGVVLNGLTADGKQNGTIIDAASYYLNTYSWGSWPGSGSSSTYEGAVFDNNFIKFRELSLNYTMPVKLKSKVKAQNLTVGVFGRNLFYLYKSLPNLDPEVGIGSSFVSQGIESGTTAASRTMGVNLRLSF
ncbi:SusC/RagA family TonB-linked outer membrane protein [Chitinophaga sp. HK235]|uniref:SusC/RagA family TonB-linked outer membrane protein n=1 Tax=Chitinophaga sp. HK235 TaxID=2952571 RepID=UPI001BA9E850|nr:SusC/RagA family TonB-linked outer membrane protein [Chitinophaga sp. HK235]